MNINIRDDRGKILIPPLAIEKVRWYYSKREFFQIVPEIPQRGDFLRCNEIDSAALEKCYRANEAEIQREWWSAVADEHMYTLKKEKTPPPALGSSPSRSASGSSASLTAAAFPPEDPKGVPRSFALEAGPVDEIGPTRAVIMGNLHVADLATRCTAPLYYKGPRHRLLRGTWFLERNTGEWGPLRESLAEQLEEAYRNEIWNPSRGNLKLQSDGTLAARVALTTKGSDRYFALFLSDRESYLCSDSTFAKVKRSMGGAPGLRLRRGYEPPGGSTLLSYEADTKREEEEMMSTLTPVRHLILVVHGIGQKLELADVSKDTAQLRDCVRSLELQQAASDAAASAASDKEKEKEKEKEKDKDKDRAHSPTGAASPGTQAGGAAGVFEGLSREGSSASPVQGSPAAATAAAAAAAAAVSPLARFKRPARVELLPVQWRKEILLDIDSVAEDITPHGVPSLRGLLTTLTVDLMYWLSPMHCEKIVTSVVSQLNRQYYRFLTANPSFEADGGKVSLLGHSLGSVLTFDVLANQPRLYRGVIDGIQDAISSDERRRRERAEAEERRAKAKEERLAAAAAANVADKEKEAQKEDKKKGLMAAIAEKADLVKTKAEAVQAAASASAAAARDKVRDKLQRKSQSPPPRPSGLDSGSGAFDGMAPVEGPQVSGEFTGPEPSAPPAPPSPREEAARLDKATKLAELERLEGEVARLRDELSDTAAGGSGASPVAPTSSSSQVTVFQYLWGMGGHSVKESADDEDEEPLPSPTPHPLGRMRFQPFPAVVHPLDPALMATSAVAPHRFIKFPELAFKVENFFGVGSPVGIFLALRGVNPRAGKALGSAAAVRHHASTFGGVGDCLPACRRWYNIYHPFDPVGFRIEPLIDPANKERRPVLIPYYRGGLRIHHQVEEYRVGFENLANRASSTASGLVSETQRLVEKAAGLLRVGVVSASEKRKEDDSSHGEASGDIAVVQAAAAVAGASLGPGGSTSSFTAVAAGVAGAAGSPRNASERSTDASLSNERRGTGAMSDAELEKVHYIFRLTEGPEPPRGSELAAPSSREIEGRLDFMIQDHPIMPQYLSATEAHFMYWTSMDTALFILRACSDQHPMDGQKLKNTP